VRICELLALGVRGYLAPRGSAWGRRRRQLRQRGRERREREEPWEAEKEVLRPD
jgi:hypothetical protein